MRTPLRIARRPLATALTLLAAAALAAGCGSERSDGGRDGADTATTTTTTTTSTSGLSDEAPATEPAEGGDCSAADLDLELPSQPDLPKQVAGTREQLFEAAMACDFDALGRIAQDNEGAFGFTFGTERDPVAYWRSVDAEQQVLARLAQILTAPYVQRDEAGQYYAWPSTYQDAPTAADYDALVATGAVTEQESATYQREGSYLGYRTAILPNGRWSFLLAGD